MGVWGLESGAFLGFLEHLAKVRWGCLIGLFGCFSLVCGWFWRGGGHFRTARSGVYMVIGETDSVIRFGFLSGEGDAREGTVRRAGHSSVEQVESRRLETGDAHFSGLGLNPLPRLSTRCRGAPRRRGRSGRVWDLVFDRLADKKPQRQRGLPPLSPQRQRRG